MSNLIIYTCPKCGNDLQELCLPSIPPQYKIECFKCGWSKMKYSDPIGVKRIQYPENECINDKTYFINSNEVYFNEE